MSIKKLLNFSNGFYFFSALVFFAIVIMAGLNLKNIIHNLDKQIVYLNNIEFMLKVCKKARQQEIFF
ncbi:MAG: hypothetical protein ACP5IH_08225 [Desulfurella sp.]|uniref:Methyl-accepting chemotaxis protein n=1 Tax=Desulfurella multipotens TaxID=79269 RepID=A0A1G6L0S2_9BACT|nr:hypothetical protein [Desulfurella multipotens]SDC36773.1 methyl-accepting chemotaxis protein [Desulfurella multipotens]